MKDANCKILKFPSQKKIEIDRCEALLIKRFTESEGHSFTSSPEQMELMRTLAEHLCEVDSEKEAYDQRLASKWDNPELVANEKGFKDAAEFFRRLHPDTHAVALALLQQQ